RLPQLAPEPAEVETAGRRGPAIVGWVKRSADPTQSGAIPAMVLGHRFARPNLRSRLLPMRRPAVPDLKSLIRTIPDYPKKGIMFRDVTTLLSHAEGFGATVAQMAASFTAAGVQAVAGIEARGFILGGAVADRLGCGFVPIRKKGKLPWKTIGQE